jgi:hypothetical protein
LAEKKKKAKKSHEPGEYIAGVLIEVKVAASCTTCIVPNHCKIHKKCIAGFGISPGNVRRAAV